MLNPPATQFETTVNLADGTPYTPRLTRGQYVDAFTLRLPDGANSTGLTGKQRFTAALAVQIWGDNASEAVKRLERYFADSDPSIRREARSACREILGLPYWDDVTVTLRLTTPTELRWYGCQTVECHRCEGTGDAESEDEGTYSMCNHCDGEGSIVEEEADFVTNWEGKKI